MSGERERRRKEAVHGFRSAGTHFRFHNGWQVRILANDPASLELCYEISIYDPAYHPLSVAAGISHSLAKADSDCVALILAAVRGLAEETPAEAAAQAVAALLA
jgi:hypothetical protein